MPDESSPPYEPQITEELPDSSSATRSQAFQDGIGSVIAGKYRLVELIGQGGMGAVYLAQQTQPVKRQVAVKLIKTGADSASVLARFDAERQALALMDHPHIARVYDGGTTPTGMPFFVMELVRGVPITTYCDEHRLSVGGRLALFVSVCQAVQHAHQKGIIHRDLKPGNVLVIEVDGKPVPKVIDFGLAKAIEQNLTEMSFEDVGLVVGTAAYMSPEQADPSTLDIDTRTDVYALGVMLYELLVGSLPIDTRQFKRGALLEILRMVREVEPPRPSTRLSTAGALPSIAANRNIEPAQLTKILRGELDWVVMKALEKERTRRYETVNGLARDVLRYLADEVVEARPPSYGYRLKKFVRRNRGQAIAAGLLLLSLVAGIVGTTLGLFEARTQRDAAENARADEATQRAAAVESARQATASAAAEKLAKKDAEEKARLAIASLKRLEKATESLVGVFHNIDPSSEEKEGLPLRMILARNLIQTADALQGGDAGDPVSTARMQSWLGVALHSVGDATAAITVLERSAATYRDTLGPDDPATLDTTNQLALAYRADGKTSKALELLIDVLERSKATRGPDHIETLGCMNNLAVTYRSAGETAKAFPYYLAVEAKTRATMGPNHQSTLAAANDLALAHKDLGRLDEALPLLEKTLATARATLGDDHVFTLNAMNNLAGAYGQAREIKKAMPLLLEALAGRRAKLGPTHPDTLQSMNLLAMAHVEAREPAQAIPLLEEALAGRRARFGPDHPQTLNTVELLAQAYLVGGQVDKALPLMADTLTRTEAKLGKDHPSTLGLMNNLASSYWVAKQFDKSVPLFERLLPLHQKKFGPDHPLTLNVLANLGVNYRDAGRLKEAVAILEDAVRRIDQLPPINVARLSWVRIALTSTYERAGQHDKAEAAYRQAWNEAVQQSGEDHVSAAAAATLLAANLLKQSKHSDAEPLLVRALATREKAAPDDWTTFNTRSLLGAALLGQKKYAEAEPLLLAGYEGLKKRETMIPSQGSTRIPEGIDRLIDLYTATNKLDEAKKWQAERAKYPAEQALPPPEK
ncbi:MAG: tetratricopeptide repeat protein [Pirellulaceae bacterium]